MKYLISKLQNKIDSKIFIRKKSNFRSDRSGVPERCSLNSNKISNDLHEIIIGLTLGDLHIRKRFLNSSLNFKGGLKNKEYIFHLYEIFKLYCKTKPKIIEAKLKNKIYYSVKFDTLTNEIFNIYHNLFYENKIKKVPNNIKELLTPIGLAYWAMDDGSPDRSGFIFYTNSFIYEDVLLLTKILKENFDLNCSIHIRKTKEKKQYMIYIKADSFDKFVKLVTPYFHSSMLYKLEKRK